MDVSPTAIQDPSIARDNFTKPGVLRVAGHFLKAMRPVQWVKNVFVLAPLVFGLKLSDGAALSRALLAAFAFCLVSSAVYVLNDIVDREQDARHPTKRRRPIASGALPVEAARFGVGILVMLSLALGALLTPALSVVLAAYFALNVAYTWRLKHIAFIDIACIALGFLLRVVAGGLATAVEVSVWLFACTFLLASLLALGKRRHELVAVHKVGGSTRAVLDQYRVEHIDWAMRALAVVTVLSYALYTVSESTVANFGTRSLLGSVPFVLFGIFRFNQLVARHDDAQSPTDTMVRDLPFLANGALFSVFITLVIYLGW